MRSVAALVAIVAAIAMPTAAACGGLSPGDELIAGGARCTLAFLLVDESGLYFATAGHCIKVNQTANNPSVGNFGVGAFRYLVPDTGSETDGSPGNDFGLIRVDPEYYDQLNPKVCGWAGPTGIYENAPGSGEVHHYGYGLVFGDVSEDTRPRTGYNLANDNTSFSWTGMGLPGDSGSAVLAQDGRALGVLTHLVVAPPDTNGGTHLLRGFALAAEKGYHLRLVLAGEDPVAKLAELKKANATMPPKTNVTTTTLPTAPPPNASGNNTSTPLAPLGDAQPAHETPGFELVLMIVAGLAALFRRRS